MERIKKNPNVENYMGCLKDTITNSDNVYLIQYGPDTGQEQLLNNSNEVCQDQSMETNKDILQILNGSTE